MLKKSNFSFVVFLVAAPEITLAAELSEGNTAWLMTSTALVLFMTIPGLSLFYAGLVRAKNVLSVLAHCFVTVCIASIVWWGIGYSLAFSDGGSVNDYIGGLNNLWLSEVSRDSMSGTIPESIFLMFQLTFAVITPALIVGGFAERMKFSSMLLFTTLWLILVYAPVCHWVWGGGWLANLGLLDYAGGVVVHITAGTAALVAAIVLGPRTGFSTEALVPHNLTMTVMGAGMLWVGWFGFNGGSAFAASGDAGMAILVTHLSAAVAALVWMLIEKIKTGHPSVLGAVTGMVAGLGAITPASGYVGPQGAIIIGFAASCICFFATYLVKKKLKIDDSLDVFPVHAVGGFTGTLLVSVFVSNTWGGIGYNEGLDFSSQLGIQFTGSLAVLVWTGVVTFVILKLIHAIVGLRVDEQGEEEGLDMNQFREKGYHI